MTHSPRLGWSVEYVASVDPPMVYAAEIVWVDVPGNPDSTVTLLVKDPVQRRLMWFASVQQGTERGCWRYPAWQRDRGVEV